jgi:hypothetical protein
MIVIYSSVYKIGKTTEGASSPEPIYKAGECEKLRLGVLAAC